MSNLATDSALEDRKRVLNGIGEMDRTSALGSSSPLGCPQVLEMLNILNGEWVIFQQTLLDSEQMLKKHKEKFKTGLIHSADDFKKKAHSLLEEFGTKGTPFASSPPSPLFDPVF